VETFPFPLPQHIIFLPCIFAKNDTSGDLRGEQELAIAKKTMDNATHLGHTLFKAQRMCFPLLCSLIKADLHRCGSASMEHSIVEVVTLSESLGH
jgi:hypothetical protein